MVFVPIVGVGRWGEEVVMVAVGVRGEAGRFTSGPGLRTRRSVAFIKNEHGRATTTALAR